MIVENSSIDAKRLYRLMGFRISSEWITFWLAAKKLKYQNFRLHWFPE